MDWDEIKQAYPDQWIVIEALEAHSEGGCACSTAWR